MTNVKNEANRPHLEVISGGLNSPINPDNVHFKSAYVTDTRLMGVLAVYACWNISNGLDLHQFFYIDCEEAGLETYSSLRGEFNEWARLTEQAHVGGLGAQKMPLDEKQLRWLLQHWKNFNLKHDLPLPKGITECNFLFDTETPQIIDDVQRLRITESVKMSRAQQDALMDLTCVEISSDYQVINYFLMRCFGQDYEGARYLTVGESITGGPLHNDFPLDLYDSYRKSSFCKNVIDVEKEYRDGSVSYLCESLVEMDGKHETIISKVVVKDLKVVGFEHCDNFPVTSIEAALMLKKPEFITVYEVLLNTEEEVDGFLDEESLDANIGEFILSSNTIMSIHECGRLFMSFKSTNNHVAERVFMLSNDVRGVYFLTDFGQLIAMASTVADTQKLEHVLENGPLAPYLIPTGRYEFVEPILYEFIESGFDDFEEFLNLFEE